MSEKMKSKFRGCVIGQCLGDALGFPVEGAGPDACLAYVEKNLRSDSIIWQTSDGYPIGQYTDDSQLARELAESLVEMERYSPIDYAKRIAAIFKSNKIVGRGIASDNAAQRLISGTSWESAAEPAPSAGNGTAMRAAPAGLLYWSHPKAMMRLARDQGRITHLDARCNAGSIAIAGAVALALQADAIEPHEFLETIGEWVEDEHDAFATLIQQLAEWIELDIDEAVPLIARAGVAKDFQDGWRWISPFVIPSVLWSLYAFLKTPDDYMQSIRCAIQVGGDVDTTAAMAGAISGAYLGLEGIPETAAKEVQDQGEWGWAELLQLADRLYDLSEQTNA